MATERIDIVIREHGSRVVRRGFKQVAADALTARRSVDTFKTALAAIGVGLVVRETLRLADTFQHLQNRLRVVTDSEVQLKDVTEQLFAVSQRTRSSFESTVELYSRLAISSKELGVNQQQLVEFTESLNQAIILSGASAQEANAGLIQLSQGIASGTLRGDELRSVLEQLPVVADVIAKELGITRGELRELGQQGKITAQDIIIAFQSSRDELAERFGKTVPTINQALQVLRNSLQRAAETDLGGLTDSIVGLANRIDDPDFQRSLGSFVSGMVRLAELSFDGLEIFTEIAQGIGILAAEVRGISDANDPLQLVEDTINRIQHDIVETKGIIRDSIGDDAIKELLARDDLESLQKELQLQIHAREQIIKDLQSTSGGQFVTKPPDNRSADPIQRVTSQDPKALAGQADFLQGLRDQSAELQFQIKYGDEAAAAISRYSLAIELAGMQATPEFAAQARLLNEEIISLTQAFEHQQEVQQRISDQDDFISALEEQTSQLQFQRENADYSAESLERYRLMTEAATLGDEAFVTAAQLKIDKLYEEQEAARLYQEQQSAAQRILEDIATPQEIFNGQIEELIGLYKAGFLTAEQYARAVLMVRKEFVEASKEIDPALEQMNNFLRKAQENAQDILASAFRNGFDDIRQDFSDLLLDLAAQFAASKIFSLLGNIGSNNPNGGGGIGTAIASFFGGKFGKGGSFIVPGSGGIDSRLAVMQVSPRERVTVETPQQQQSSGRGSGGLVFAPSFILPQASTPAQLRETTSQVGAATYQAARRAFRRNN